MKTKKHNAFICILLLLTLHVIIRQVISLWDGTMCCFLLFSPVFSTLTIYLECFKHYYSFSDYYNNLHCST